MTTPYRHQRERLTLASAPRAGLALRRRARLAWRRLKRWVAVGWPEASDNGWSDDDSLRYIGLSPRDDDQVDSREYARRRSSLPD